MKRKGKAIISRAAGGRAKWEFCIRSSNGRVLANGYGYNTAKSAAKGIDALRRCVEVGMTTIVQEASRE